MELNELLSLEEINKNYSIEREIGRGGMGVVYLATDKRLERPVAIKVLNLSSLEEFSDIDTGEVIERFKREAKAVAKLSHANIVSIFDIGTQNNLHYMVMEYLEGQELSRLIPQNKFLEVEEVINVGIDICKALSFVHERGIIHRDIKPANIVLTSNKVAKLMDFGIAQLNKEGHKRLTQDGSVLGSLIYISPEQLTNSRNVDIRADIYSLGATLYELLVGLPPFKADNVATLVMSILKDKPHPPSEKNTKVPPALDKIIEKALSKDISERYQTADEMARDLKNLILMLRDSAMKQSKGYQDEELKKKIEEEVRHKIEEELQIEKEKLSRQKMEGELRQKLEEEFRFEREKLQLEKERMEERYERERFRQEMDIEREKLRLERERIEKERIERAEHERIEAEERARANVSPPPPPGATFSKPQIVSDEKPQNVHKEVNIKSDEKPQIVNKEVNKNKELFEKAKKYIEDEDYDIAIGCLRTLIDFQPKVAQYHSYLGLALVKKGWDGYAQAEFKVALHHDPSDPVALEYFKSTREKPKEEHIHEKSTVKTDKLAEQEKTKDSKFFSKFKNFFKN